jgi:valyl-tRNA synthetase
MARVEALLANPGFTGKAPAAVVEREQARLAEARERQEKLRARLKSLAG